MMINEKNNDDFPKVLIIGQSFNLKGGGGITLTNLFKDWPLEKIAVATMDIDSTGYAYCINYYRIGYQELRRPWPFHYFQEKIKSVEFHARKGENERNSTIYKVPSGEKRGVKRLYHKMLEYSGLKPLIYRMNVSSRFEKWFNDYNPDIIYTQLSDLPSINFIKQIMEKHSHPLVIHIMDDWPMTLDYPGILYYYWKYKLNKEFRLLLNRAKVLMSICHAMSEEYLQRYGKFFLPFQNTIDIARFNYFLTKKWDIKGDFNLFYAGRIGRGTYNSVLTIAKAVEKLGKEGLRIRFIVRTNSIPDAYKKEMKNYSYTVIKDYLPHKEIPKELSDMDALIIPLDFVELEFTRLSMPTKVPEYLASGTPVIIFAPKTTALYKYANELKWGYTVTENKIESLAHGIKELYMDKELREKLGKTARTIAMKNHDGQKIRKKFRDALKRAVS